MEQADRELLQRVASETAATGAKVDLLTTFVKDRVARADEVHDQLHSRVGRVERKQHWMLGVGAACMTVLTWLVGSKNAEKLSALFGG